MAREPAAVHCWCCPREKTTRRRGSSSRKTSSWTALASGRTQASRRLGARKLATQRLISAGRLQRASKGPRGSTAMGTGGRQQRTRLGPEGWQDALLARCSSQALLQTRSADALFKSWGVHGQNSAIVTKPPIFPLAWPRGRPSVRTTTQAPSPTP